LYYLLNEKNGIHFIQRDEVMPKSGFFTYWVGWVGQNNFEYWSCTVYNVNSLSSLMVRIFQALSKYFSGKDGSPIVKKLPRSICRRIRRQ